MRSILFMSLLFTFQLQAQSISTNVLSTSGAFYTANGYTLSQTIGETAVQIYTQPTLILTQGFQQVPNLTSGVNEISFDQLGDATLFPNFTEGVFFVKYTFKESGKANFGVFTTEGKATNIYQSKPYLSGNEETRFDLTSLPNGLYLVQLSFETEKGVTTEKVFKLQISK